MEVSALVTLIIAVVVWVPLCMARSTEVPSHWISCTECSKGFNSTFNQECKYGCDRFLRRSRVRSITVPTAHTKKGYYWLDCKDCFGHAIKHRDPNCKYGCGHWVRFSTPTPGPSTKMTTEKNDKNSDQPETRRHRVMKSNSHSVAIGEAAPTGNESSPRRAYTRYQVPFLFIGVAAGVAASIIGLLVYKKCGGHGRVASGVEKVESGGDAIVIYNT